MEAGELFVSFNNKGETRMDHFWQLGIFSDADSSWI
jgi:hypothetical protein